MIFIRCYYKISKNQFVKEMQNGRENMANALQLTIKNVIILGWVANSSYMYYVPHSTMLIVN